MGDLKLEFDAGLLFPLIIPSRCPQLAEGPSSKAKESATPMAALWHNLHEAHMKPTVPSPIRSPIHACLWQP